MTDHTSPTILMYHDIRDFDRTSFPRRYEGTSFLTPAEFAAQLDYIEERYAVISLVDLVRRLAEGEPTSRLAVLTFDDGLADHFDQVRPALLARGLPATFFVPTAPVFEHAMIPSNKIQFVLAALSNMRDVVEETFKEIDNRREEFPDLPSRASLWAEFSVSLWPNNTWSPEEVFMTRLLRSGLRPDILRNHILDTLFARFVCDDEVAFAKEFYLTGDQVAVLHSDGFEIGGHGHLSIPLSSLPAREISEDLARSAQLLTDALPEIATRGRLAMSYPNGALNGEVLDAAAAAGFSVGLTTEATTVSDAHPALRLPRFNAPAHLPPKGTLG